MGVSLSKRGLFVKRDAKVRISFGMCKGMNGNLARRRKKNIIMGRMAPKKEGHMASKS